MVEWLLFLFVFGLIACSAFFSASETALTAVSRARLHQQSKQGNRRAQIIEKLQTRIEQVIAALLLANIALNTIATTLATSVFMSLLGEQGIVVASVVMTLAVLLFAEILPKVYAFHYPEHVAFAMAPMLEVMVRILSPLTRFLHAIVHYILKIFGNRSAKSSLDSTEEELRGAISLHVRATAAKPQVLAEEKAMLNSILDLHTLTVEEIMVHRKNCMMLKDSSTLQDVQDAVQRTQHTRFPVYHGNPENIVGILNVRDLWGQEPRDFKLTEWVRPPWFIPSTMLLSDQLQAFRAGKNHMALVVDEYGALQGLVTLKDILEEIVGEIIDEDEMSGQNFYHHVDGHVVVAGDATLRDLNRQFGWHLDDENATTIAGLMLHLGEKIPETGAEFHAYDLTLKVLEKEGPHITRVQITPDDVGGEGASADQLS